MYLNKSYIVKADNISPPLHILWLKIIPITSLRKSSFDNKWVGFQEFIICGEIPHHISKNWVMLSENWVITMPFMVQMYEAFNWPSICCYNTSNVRPIDLLLQHVNLFIHSRHKPLLTQTNKRTFSRIMTSSMVNSKPHTNVHILGGNVHHWIINTGIIFWKGCESPRSNTDLHLHMP